RLYTQAIESKPKIKEIRVSLGYAYFRLRRYDEAIRALKEELSLFPDSHNAYILLGYIYFNQNKLRDAFETCTAYDSSFNVLIKKKALIKRLPKKFNPGSAKHQAILTEIRNENPNLGLPNFILGLVHKENGNFPEAETHFTLAYARGYDPTRCTTQLLDIDTLEEKWEQGLKKAQDALIQEGPQPEIYFMAGFIYYQLKQIENAIFNFETSLEMKPYLFEAIRNLAIIHYNQEEFEKASQLFKKVTKFNPYDLNAEFYSTDALKKEEQSQKIEEKLELTKDITDKVDVKYVYTLKNDVQFISKLINETALSLIRSGNLNEAMVGLQEFLKISDISPEMNYNLGQLHNASNNPEKALKYALRAVELDGDFKDAYDLIGNIYFKIQDYENSLQAYREVIRINSGDAMGHYNLGCVYSALNNFDEAENCWKTAIQSEKGIKKSREKKKKSEDKLKISVIVHKRPVSFRAHKALGMLYVEQNLKDKALVEFEKASKLEPDDQESHYELGKIYQTKKDFQKAIFHYEKYLYLGGEEEEEVKKILKTLKRK
ncbi:MAG: tetratricopeptide repeat protein, partial [Candidatus Aminicenantes bacterium]